MKQKILSTIFFLLFIGIFWYFYGGEYVDFYKQKNLEITQKNIIEKSLKDFSVKEVSQVKNLDFFATPNKKLLNTIVKKIDLSQEKVYLEVYIFTEKRIFEALKRAKNRWVDIQVILEKNPYMAPKLNNKRFSELIKSWISVKWSNPKNYSLNHAKFFIVDNEVIISTGNMSYSTFSRNRDFFLFIQDKDILQNILEIFKNDFEGIIYSPYQENLVLSPNYSRAKIKKMFLSAEKSIYMYFQYLKDDELEEVLKRRVKENIDIQIIVDDDFYKKEIEKVKMLEKIWIKIKKYSGTNMHAKAILVDKKSLFIGSVNFSHYSFDKNREIGVILSNEEIIKKFLRVFELDFFGK